MLFDRCMPEQHVGIDLLDLDGHGDSCRSRQSGHGILDSVQKIAPKASTVGHRASLADARGDMDKDVPCIAFGNSIDSPRCRARSHVRGLKQPRLYNSSMNLIDESSDGDMFLKIDRIFDRNVRHAHSHHMAKQVMYSMSFHGLLFTATCIDHR